MVDHKRKTIGIWKENCVKTARQARPHRMAEGHVPWLDAKIYLWKATIAAQNNREEKAWKQGFMLNQ